MLGKTNPAFLQSPWSVHLRRNLHLDPALLEVDGAAGAKALAVGDPLDLRGIQELVPFLLRIFNEPPRFLIVLLNEPAESGLLSTQELLEPVLHLSKRREGQA